MATVYKSIYLQPQNVAINATVNNILSCVVDCNTSITQYRWRIWRISDNALIYDSGVLATSTPLFSKQILNHILPLNSLVNGVEYKHSVYTSDGTNNATSDEIGFITNAGVAITFIVPAVVTTQSYKFAPTYSQSNGVGVEYTFYRFYNSTDELLLETDKNYTGDISYTFEGFVDNVVYKVRLYGRTQNGVDFESNLISFLVNYPSPNVNLKPNATQDACSGNITVIWGEGIVIISGTSSGTISYYDNWYQVGNKALIMNNGAYATWTFAIPSQFNSVHNWQKQSGFTNGKIIELFGITQNYEFGYDSSKSRFYFKIGLSYGYSDIIALPTDPVYIILRPFDAYVKLNNTIYRVYVRGDV